MPKPKRPENKKLPPRWRFHRGRYRYRVPPGLEHEWDGKTEYTLGQTLAEAHLEFSRRVRRVEDCTTMERLVDRYRAEVLPGKAPATQRSNAYSLGRIRAAFCGNDVAAIRPVHCYQYQDYIHRTESAKKANLDHEVLSHLFSMAIKWGIRDDHPMTGRKVTKIPMAPRSRYVEDWELAEWRKVAGPFLNAYVDLKMLLAADKCDLLGIKRDQIKDDGLLLEPRRKTRTSRRLQRQRLIPFATPDGNTTGVREALDAILGLHKGRAGSLWLFSTRRGQPYLKPDGNTSGFDSIWDRRMRKALADTGLQARFTEKDLRTKVASDQESDERARELLDHASVNTTREHYRARPVVILPAGRKKR